MKRFLIALVLGLSSLLQLSGCASSDDDDGVPVISAAYNLYVYYNPYHEVDWVNDYRLKAQHHDHIRTAGDFLAYDAAGYDVVSLMHYSGMVSLDYAWREKRWPPEDWLPKSLLDNLQNIKFFIPNAEEMGFAHHLTSPFLTSYVELWEYDFWEPGYYLAKREPWHHESTQELIDMINENGGMAFIAHPWRPPFRIFNPLRSYDKLGLKRYAGVEIYNALGEARRRQGEDPFFSKTDRNAILIVNWDRILMRDQSVLGIAVNDHFGPRRNGASPSTDPDIEDSGKIVVISHSITVESYRNALEQGAFFAIKDMGVIKDQHPDIRSISVNDTSIIIETADEVAWVANGQRVASGNRLEMNKLPSETLYVRAEVRNDDGSIVYTQAFTIRPVGQD